MRNLIRYQWWGVFANWSSKILAKTVLSEPRTEPKCEAWSERGFRRAWIKFVWREALSLRIKYFTHILLISPLYGRENNAQTGYTHCHIYSKRLRRVSHQANFIPKPVVFLPCNGASQGPGTTKHLCVCPIYMDVPSRGIYYQFRSKVYFHSFVFYLLS